MGIGTGIGTHENTDKGTDVCVCECLTLIGAGGQHIVASTCSPRGDALAGWIADITPHARRTAGIACI
jgi:hypothetical protein